MVESTGSDNNNGEARHCRGLMPDGAPCTNPALADGYCWMHGGTDGATAIEDRPDAVPPDLPATGTPEADAPDGAADEPPIHLDIAEFEAPPAALPEDAPADSGDAPASEPVSPEAAFQPEGDIPIPEDWPDAFASDTGEPVPDDGAAPLPPAPESPIDSGDLEELILEMESTPIDETEAPDTEDHDFLVSPFGAPTFAAETPPKSDEGEASPEPTEDWELSEIPAEEAAPAPGDDPLAAFEEEIDLAEAVVPPQFDLFEELPGEDWTEIEVNIEDGAYSADDLEHFTPDLSPVGPDWASDAAPEQTDTADAPPYVRADDFHAAAEAGQQLTETDIEPAESPPPTEVSLPPPQVGMPKPTAAAQPPQEGRFRRISLPLPIFVLVCVAVAAVAAGAAILLGPSRGENADVSAIQLGNIQSRFISHPESGSLFVITGHATNGTDHPLRFIQVIGKIYTSDRYAHSLTVYCGNVMPVDDLANLSIAQIVSQLRDRAGATSASPIADGDRVPLMIVFPIRSNEMALLETYTVEVHSSVRAD